MNLIRLVFMVLVFSTKIMAQNHSTLNMNKVIAHRGAWKAKNLPQNSIASLQEAIKLNCYGSEFDVQLTSDSIPVVNHDPDFMGLPIATSTYQQLRAKQLSNGEYIPTLESYIKAALSQQSTKLILEIKPQKNKDLEILLTQKVLHIVHDLKAQGWIEYISFSYHICQYLVAHEKGAKVSYLEANIDPDQLKRDGLSGFDYHYTALNKNNWIERAAEIGLSTNAWTVNDAKDMDKLIERNIDYITTNEPEVLFERLKHKKGDE